ncbi:hypothetical protein LCGC14_0791910 [marine sediment metagenome]|uniref:Uncharacterized protein n=1 Tax=marine sediment metagenome TaxID=412755 RepID=A0A0F9SC70_9ZZZZ
MKIKTNIVEIEIKPTKFYEEYVRDVEVVNTGSDIVKLLLEKTTIKNIKVEYTEDEKDV